VTDAHGEPQSLIVLGGASELALATAHVLVARRTRTVVLAGRPSARLDAACAALRAAGARRVEAVAFDALEPRSHTQALDAAFEAAGEDVDVVLVAAGVLGPRGPAQLDQEAALEVLGVNATGAISATLLAAQRLRAQGHGTLVVLSSVAGERPRRVNFLYGASKAALDAFAQGLGDELRGSGVHVLVVRPGFVSTRMTRGLPRAPLSTTPDAVAAAIVAGLRRRAEIVWVPAPLRFAMSAIRHLPRSLARRLPG
jgi:decaprenylphospho-beta-D-erythro-pentofuranosid-2-ulose 2-reductase